jgi:FMN phosphatase YigB (HAD superfamily)
MIQSFDIFDTCLIRRVAEPAEVFDLMGGSHAIGLSFRFYRQEAEREASRRHGEATLLEIHEILSTWMGHGVSRRDELIAAELEEEARQLVPVPGMLEHIREVRSRGGRIAFLSDMYLPSGFLEDRLREHGFYQNGDLLLVSCECKKSKVSGALYQEAKRRLGETTWQHYGNHPQADVKAATRAGLKGIYRPWGNLTRHEEALLAWSRTHGGYSHSWAGAARHARINSGASSREEQIIAEIAAGIAGPLVFIFSSWLVERAASLELNTLFFLARDGQVFMEAFNRIAQARGIKTRAKYLYASRIALRFPRKFPLSDEDAAGVFQGSGKVPVSVVAARLGVSEGRLREWLSADSIHGQMIFSSKVADIRSVLTSPGIVSELQNTATSRSQLLLNYLEQEGFLNEETPTVVDLGWNGSLQAGLEKALQAAGCESTVTGLYLGLASFPYPALKAQAFLYDNRIAGVEFPHWTTSVTEVLCQADHGSTLGFIKNKAGEISPVLDEADGKNPLVPNWFTIHRETIHNFVMDAVSVHPSPFPASGYKRLLIKLLEGFWLTPSRDEARVWGECRFASHGLSETSVPMAPTPSTLGELLAVLGIKNSKNTQSIWREGSAAKLPLMLPSLFRGYRRMKAYLRRRLR